ncbi:MAG: hypothetical protein KGQ60_01750 [Planctomycetes bacterium]|nr:hypothetical protein [Planctomycetota bacterium]
MHPFAKQAAIFLIAFGMGNVAFSQPTVQPMDRIVLEKGKLKLELYRPGSSENYRGTRFDHSGMFHSIRYDNVSLCQRWHPGPPNPEANDDVTGPCEEFGNSQPLGFRQDDPGSRFIKIGVGILKQPDSTKYQFMRKYEFVQYGQWTTTIADSAVHFDQELVDKSQVSSIGYAYRKTIRLLDDGFAILHELRNLGQEALITDHYNHNFFLIDGDPVGEHYSLQVPYAIEAAEKNEFFDALVNVQGKGLAMRNDIGKRSYFARLNGHRGEITDTRFSIRHAPTRIRIDCMGDEPLYKFNFWGMANTFCPEPYVLISVPPGQTRNWALRYTISRY